MARRPETSPDESALHAEAGSPESADPRELLESLLDGDAYVDGVSSEPLEPGAHLLGVCIDDRHPTLVGRVRVHWKRREGQGEGWLPKLQHVPVRRGDQVLLTQPCNGAEPIVIGVVDGFAHRERQPSRDAATLTLREDEVVRVDDARGRPLLELRAEEGGPVVRLARQGLALELDGKLAFRADAIQLEARRGAIEIEATDDVCVRGEVVHLN